MSLGFLKDFEKKISKVDGITGTSLPPQYWISTGCYVLNKIISGSFNNGIPQGRLTALAGPSGCLTKNESVNVYVMRSHKSDRKVVEVKS